MILDDQHAFGEVRRLSNGLSDRSLTPRSAGVLRRPSGGTVPRTAAGTLSRCHDPDPERASGKSRRQTFSDAGRFPELMVNARIGAILGCIVARTRARERCHGLRLGIRIQIVS